MSADGAGTMVVAAAPSGAAATTSAGPDPRQGILDEATELQHPCGVQELRLELRVLKPQAPEVDLPPVGTGRQGLA